MSEVKVAGDRFLSHVQIWGEKSSKPYFVATLVCADEFKSFNDAWKYLEQLEARLKEGK